ncbi:uncharacterized protein LOC121879760 [Homarus americanus]|uniref:uncharacterized protein LOC121879760 n=1 Tax=Homarus americanus TaxID=6706 RepID=UPI001C4616F0|nr:uncharacterized protein LOC121879760 [Homarus americanus]
MVYESPTDERHMVYKAPTDERHMVYKAPTDERHMVYESPTDERHMVYESPTDEKDNVQDSLADGERQRDIIEECEREDTTSTSQHRGELLVNSDACRHYQDHYDQSVDGAVVSQLIIANGDVRGCPQISGSNDFSQNLPQKRLLSNVTQIGKCPKKMKGTAEVVGVEVQNLVGSVHQGEQDVHTHINDEQITDYSGGYSGCNGQLSTPGTSIVIHSQVSQKFLSNINAKCCIREGVSDPTYENPIPGTSKTPELGRDLDFNLTDGVAYCHYEKHGGLINVPAVNFINTACINKDNEPNNFEGFHTEPNEKVLALKQFLISSHIQGGGSELNSPTYSKTKDGGKYDWGKNSESVMERGKGNQGRKNVTRRRKQREMNVKGEGKHGSEGMEGNKSEGKSKGGKDTRNTTKKRKWTKRVERKEMQNTILDKAVTDKKNETRLVEQVESRSSSNTQIRSQTSWRNLNSEPMLEEPSDSHCEEVNRCEIKVNDDDKSLWGRSSTSANYSGKKRKIVDVNRDSTIGIGNSGDEPTDETEVQRAVLVTAHYAEISLENITDKHLRNGKQVVKLEKKVTRRRRKAKKKMVKCDAHKAGGMKKEEEKQPLVQEKDFIAPYRLLFDSDSDELPDLNELPVHTGKTEYDFKTGDLVWSLERDTWWPSCIQQINPYIKRPLMYFIGRKQDTVVKVKVEDIRPYKYGEVPSYVDQNKSGFSVALHLTESYCQLQKHGNTISIEDFCNMPPEEQDALVIVSLTPKDDHMMTPQNRKKKPEEDGTKKRAKKSKKKWSYELVNQKTEMNSYQLVNEEFTLTPREKIKFQSAMKVRKRENEKLLKFITSSACMEHLWQIFNGEKPCERHEAYQDMFSRRGLLCTGIGPFQLDHDDEQILFVVDFLCTELTKGKPEFHLAKDYVFRVWMPEAIKEALRVVRKVPESELELAMNEGYRETKIERKARRMDFM